MGKSYCAESENAFPSDKALFERLLSADSPPRLSVTEMARLEAFLKPGLRVSANRLRAARRGQDPEYLNWHISISAERAKLHAIRDFNRMLLERKVSETQESEAADAERDGNAPAKQSKSKRPRMTQERAIGLLAMHPEWALKSKGECAALMGMHAQRFSNWPRVLKAYDLAREQARRQGAELLSDAAHQAYHQDEMDDREERRDR
jgi:hypothetical protein